ncbi:hypothetical protein [Parageobacillus thermoglucosidasius]|uniref:hypothetical protein n=1 Tax=Parageobacillus thermoglucosidasius TaxID=1426 RepID=UPI002E1FECE9|nr:hypothetical protein [Parageobacillus thermoglucosidasius]MED4946494.1 hypothetical protein [Parageobacillus thermoglucosidasius]MED4984055.1 hypothetical protein [Parageobacillus thermoglucosidasius]
MANVKFLLKRSIGTAKGVLKAGTEIDLDEAVAKSWEAAGFGKIVSKSDSSAAKKEEKNIEPPAAEEVKVEGPKETKTGRKERKNKSEKEDEEK